MIHYADDWLTLHQGDCRTVMAEMEPESVQTVVTSPPYFGLRDYGIEPTVWGGEEHEHEWQTTKEGTGTTASPTPARMPTTLGSSAPPTTGFCSCGAWLGVLGLEPTVELYVAHMVEVFREIRRVLRKDGTVWLNLGDSYAGSWGAQSQHVLSVTGKEPNEQRSTEPGSGSSRPVTTRNTWPPLLCWPLSELPRTR